MAFFYNLFIIFIIIFLILSYVSKPFVNPYLCIGYIGKKGSGKTTKLTSIAIKEIKKGNTVYCTERICGTKYINPADIGFYDFEENSIVLIDEIGIVFPARDFKNFKPKVREWFKLQRHKKVKVYWFTQTWVDCDKSIRDLTDRLYLCHNFFHMWSTYRKVTKVLTIGTSKNEDGSQGNQGSDFIEVFKFEPLIFPGALEITFIPRWIYFYNSYASEILPPINYELMDISETQKEYFSNKKAMRTFFSLLITRIKEDLINIFNKFKTRIILIYYKIYNKIAERIKKANRDLEDIDDIELYDN